MPPQPWPDDNIPDMTLPERTEPVPASLASSVPAPPRTWQPGDRVLAPWEPAFLYAGVVAELSGGRALIDFDDGDTGWVRLDQLRPLAVVVGQPVLSRRDMGLHFFPGSIAEVRGDQIRVRFDDGTEGWTGIGGLRIPCQPLGPGAEPVHVGSHEAYFRNLQRGDRVWAPWNSACLFPGTIAELSGAEVRIDFDDGDRGWVQRNQVLPLLLTPGMLVFARRRTGQQYHAGTIVAHENGRLRIAFDDAEEWVTVRALALPCEPFGRDARPVQGAASLLRWVVPAVVILFFLFRLVRALSP